MLYLYISLGVLGFLLLGFVVSLFVVAEGCYKGFFKRKPLSPKALTDEHYTPFRQMIIDARKRMEQLPYTEYVCRSYDGLNLVAKYYDYGKDKTVIFMHGIYSHPLNNFAVIAERFIEWGYNVLIPDERAHGKSDGSETTYGYRESRDLITWIDFMKAHSDAKLVIYGTSMGAVAVALASDQIRDGVYAAVCDCGFTSLRNSMNYLSTRCHAPSAMFKIIGAMCRRRLGIDFSESAEDHLKNSSIPTVFVHGLNDDAILSSESEKNYQACAAPKELILVEGCGHTTAAMRPEISEQIYQFIKKYI